MDLPHAVQDEVFRKLEQLQLEHLQDDVRALGHHAHIVGDEGHALHAPVASSSSVSPVPSKESTPLLVVKAGKQRVYVDPDVDLVALDKKLALEEYEAMVTDAKTPTMQMLQDEAVCLVELSIPITLTLTLEIAPLMLLGMMIGNVSGNQGPHVLAASSLSDFFQGQVTINVTSGLGAAIATLCAQSYGAKQFEQLWIFAQAGVLASLYCMPVIALACLNGPWILRTLGQDAELAHIAGQFILVGLACQPFVMMYTVARSALQAQNIAAPFVTASIVSYMVSLPLAYALGYYTSLGYIGIALSSIVSCAIKAIACIPILYKNPVFVDAWPGWKWREANQLAHKLWPITGGSVLMTTFQTLGFNVVPLLCGFLPNPAVVMTGSSLAAGLASLVFIPMMGLGASGTVRVGNALGAGQPRRASLVSWLIIVGMIAISSLGVLICWLFARDFVSLYTSDAPTIEMATRVMAHMLPLIPLASCVFAAQSIFQACRAQWLCAQLNFLFLFAMGMPLGLLFAITFDGGVFGLWNGQIIAASCFMIAASAWFSRVDWHQTAHEARLNAHLHVEKEQTPVESSAA